MKKSFNRVRFYQTEAPSYAPDTYHRNPESRSFHHNLDELLELEQDLLVISNVYVYLRCKGHKGYL